MSLGLPWHNLWPGAPCSHIAHTSGCSCMPPGRGTPLYSSLVSGGVVLPVEPVHSPPVGGLPRCSACTESLGSPWASSCGGWTPVPLCPAGCWNQWSQCTVLRLVVCLVAVLARSPWGAALTRNVGCVQRWV